MTTGFSSIDLRLALRMLVRYPGLTLVGMFGMAVGIALATAAFTVVYALLDPIVPLDEGDRVVSIVNWDAATNNREQRSLHDFAAWRNLQSIENIGAVHTVGRNLIATGGQPETVTVAEITASGFDVARVSALLGRYILPEDERPGAPDVAVIGHDVWQRRFSADPNIIGRQLQLGGTTHTIVGVMPEGFGFPVNHAFWVAWRLRCVGLRAAHWPARERLRATRTGSHHRECAGGAYRDHAAHGGSLAVHARAPACAHSALHLRLHRHGRS